MAAFIVKNLTSGGSSTCNSLQCLNPFHYEQKKGGKVRLSQEASDSEQATVMPDATACLQPGTDGAGNP